MQLCFLSTIVRTSIPFLVFLNLTSPAVALAAAVCGPGRLLLQHLEAEFVLGCPVVEGLVKVNSEGIPGAVNWY